MSMGQSDCTERNEGRTEKQDGHNSEDVSGEDSLKDGRYAQSLVKSSRDDKKAYYSNEVIQHVECACVPGREILNYFRKKAHE